jgi:putative hydrolase of the HAD superfamily
LSAPLRTRFVWFFDLDDTLHDASHAIIGQIDRRMTEFVMRELRLERERADRLRRDYWRRYGATLLGLVRHHAVDARHFLRDTHDFDILGLLRAHSGVVALLRGLPGRKVLLTNAPAAYARTVTAGLGIHRHLARHYPIESMRIHGSLRPKPAPSMLRAMLARERVGRPRAALVDDNLDNLKAARSVGLRTVWVSGRRVAGRKPDYVDLRVRDVRELQRALARVRLGGFRVAANQ